MGQISIELALAIFLPLLGILLTGLFFFLKRWMIKMETVTNENAAKIVKLDKKVNDFKSLINEVTTAMEKGFKGITDRLDFDSRLKSLESKIG